MITMYNYVLAVSIENEKYGKISNKIKIISMAICLFFSILVFFLPLELSYENQIYSYGVAVNFVYVFSFLMIITSIFVITYKL